MYVSAPLCQTLCDPMNYSPPGSSVLGILQARILGGLQFPSPGDLPDPGIEPRSSALQADSLLSEPPGKPIGEKKKRNTALDQKSEFHLKYLYSSSNIHDENSFSISLKSSWVNPTQVRQYPLGLISTSR